MNCINLNLSKKEAKDVNDNDLGEVQEVDENYILIQKQTSYVNERFYIPMYLAQKYDGNTLWFKIDQQEVRNNFIIKSDPSSKLVKFS
jgi:hypothetical protein